MQLKQKVLIIHRVLKLKNQPKHINPEKYSICEVRKMNELKGWPFGPIVPLGDGEGGGPGKPC
jgi:hypothetical protein